MEQICAILTIAELKRDIKEQEAKVEKLRDKYNAAYAERDQYEFGDPRSIALARKVNGAKLGLYSAEERLHRLMAEWYKLKYEYWELEELFSL